MQLWIIGDDSRWQVWPMGDAAPWQLQLKRGISSRVMALVVIHEMWHAMGKMNGDDLEGLLSVLPRGGCATPRDREHNVQLHCVMAVAFIGPRI